MRTAFVPLQSDYREPQRDNTCSGFKRSEIKRWWRSCVCPVSTWRPCCLWQTFYSDRLGSLVEFKAGFSHVTFRENSILNHVKNSKHRLWCDPRRRPRTSTVLTLSLLPSGSTIRQHGVSFQSYKDDCVMKINEREPSHLKPPGSRLRSYWDPLCCP